MNGQNVSFEGRLSGKHSNANNGKGQINLDNDVVEMYKERSSKEGGLLLESTLFHESTHFGNVKNYFNPDGDRQRRYSIARYESGKDFEKRAYGEDIGRKNAKQIWQMTNPSLLKSMSFIINPVVPTPIILK